MNLNQIHTILTKLLIAAYIRIELIELFDFSVTWNLVFILLNWIQRFERLK